MFLANVRKCLRIFDEVYVSSDDHEILDLAESVGAIPIYRGAELCGDVPNIYVYQHAIDYMDDADGIVAVQANSPTINPNLISLTKQLMEKGVDEVMTCHGDYSIYGSIWALTKNKLLVYDDPYDPDPSILLVDVSVDIHTEADLKEALCQKNV